MLTVFQGQNSGLIGMKINKPKQILSLDGSLAKHKFAVVFFMPGQLKTDILFILNVFLHIYFKNDGLIKSITVFIIYALLQFFLNILNVPMFLLLWKLWGLKIKNVWFRDVCTCVFTFIHLADAFIPSIWECEN